MYRNARQLNTGTPIPVNALRVGMPVHLKGADFGCVWIITAIEPRNAQGVMWLHLRTPKTGKTSRANATRARYIRAQEPGRSY